MYLASGQSRSQRFAVQKDGLSMAHSNVLIVGAGLSGIGVAAHLRRKCPQRSFRILEMRNDLGGTWDLFRYPGVRSDSDMFTLGYDFKPWLNEKAIADGNDILAYIRETAQSCRISNQITFGRRVLRVSWQAEELLWRVESRCEGSGDIFFDTCSFLFVCAGYYNYDEGHRPTFEDEGKFKGKIIHPQWWPADLDYRDKRIVVIGSGATAVTLVPALAQEAANVVMLQRSPTYVASVPAQDGFANTARRFLPAKLAYALGRWKNILIGMFHYWLSRRYPEMVKKSLLDNVRKQLGESATVEQNFTPRYNPWDQRLCAVPDGDLFKALRSGRAEVVTDHIERFTENGIQLASGKELNADIIVTATGLKLNFMGDIEVVVDGRKLQSHEMFVYKGLMFNGVPNLAHAAGYTNASWTLKVDLTAQYICRLLNHMSRIGAQTATPVLRDRSITPQNYLGLRSGYIQRASAILPKQGSKRPWRLHNNYVLDILEFRYGKIEDGVLQFDRRQRQAA